jgi:hypothetical protein
MKNTKDYAKIHVTGICAFVLLFVCWDWRVGFARFFEVFEVFSHQAQQKSFWFWKMGMVVSMLLAV